MKDINYPGLKPFLESEAGKKAYLPPPHSTVEFERLTALPPILERNKDLFNRLLNDLQANILLHHERNYTCCLFFSIKNEQGTDPLIRDRALEEIKKISEFITTANEQFAEKRRIKANGKRAAEKEEDVKPEKRNPVCCFYLTHQGYTRLGLEYFAPEDPKGAFEKGMKERLPFTFDQENGSGIWSDSGNVHAMLLLASDKKDFSDIAGKLKIKETLASLEILASLEGPAKSLDIGWAEVSVQKGFLGKKPFPGFEKEVAVEWFGYRDGISQLVFFPDQTDIGDAKFNEDDLSPLRVVLLRDRGGVHRFSAGSFLAFLQIEQDVSAFNNNIRQIAARISLCQIEDTISQKRISSVISSEEVTRAIRMVENAKIDVKKAISDRLGEKSEFLECVDVEITKAEIVPLILENKIEKLISIKEGETENVIAKIVEFINPESKFKDAIKLKDYLIDNLEILQSKKEIAFVKGEVVEKIMYNIFREHYNALDKRDIEDFKNEIFDTFYTDENEKRDIIKKIVLKQLPIFEEGEIENIILKNIKLAEAYIMGRFKNGASATLSESDQHVDQNLENAFSYQKIQSTNGSPHTSDEKGTKCPFAAHARKANPRDSAHSRLIARRGVLYGDRDAFRADKPPEDAAGMLFMSFQSDLAEQFEYIIDRWLNKVRYDQQPTGVDMLTGTGLSRSMSHWYLPIRWGTSDSNEKILLTDNEIDSCIKYKGGAYFFAPSISFLKRIDELNRKPVESIDDAKASKNTPEPENIKIAYGTTRIHNRDIQINRGKLRKSTDEDPEKIKPA